MKQKLPAFPASYWRDGTIKNKARMFAAIYKVGLASMFLSSMSLLFYAGHNSAHTVRAAEVSASSSKVVQTASQGPAELLAVSGFTQQDNSTGVSPLPDGAGKDVTLHLCTKCHSVSVFAKQRHSLDGWYQVIDQMTGKGLQASDQDVDTVARYLAKSFPEAAGGSSRESLPGLNGTFNNAAVVRTR